MNYLNILILILILELIYKIFYTLHESYSNISIKPKLYGTKYGGFFLPSNIKPKKNNIIYYGVGVGEDVSFDVIISKLFNCNVYLIDPTPKAKKHYEKLNTFLNNNKVSYLTSEGGGDKNYWNIIYPIL